MFAVSPKNAIHGCISKPEEEEPGQVYREAVTLFKVLVYDSQLDVSIVKYIFEPILSLFSVDIVMPLMATLPKDWSHPPNPSASAFHWPSHRKR
jgi:hypothetical protein